MAAPSNAFLARTLKSGPDDKLIYERLVWSRPDEPNIWDSASGGWSGKDEFYTSIRLDDEGLSEGAFIEFDLFTDKGDVRFYHIEFIHRLFSYKGAGHYEMLMRPEHIQWRKDGGEWVDANYYYWVSPKWLYAWIAKNYIVDQGITESDKNWMIPIRFDGLLGTHIDNINVYFIGNKPVVKPFWTAGVMCKYMQNDSMGAI